MQPVTADGLEVVAAEVECGVGEDRLGALVGNGRPLELEEQQASLDRGAALLRALEQRAARRLRGVGRALKVTA